MQWSEEEVALEIGRARQWLADGTWLIAATKALKSIEYASPATRQEVLLYVIAFTKILFYEAEFLRYGQNQRRKSCRKFLSYIFEGLKEMNQDPKKNIEVDLAELKKTMQSLNN